MSQTKTNKGGSMNLYEKMNTIRVELQNSGMTKSGVNKYQNFNYYTLDDIQPKLNKLLQQHKVFEVISYGREVEENFIGDKQIEVTYINAEKPEETVTFAFPVIQQTPKMQDVGAVNTYAKRYAYLNVWGIAEPEVIDSLDQTKVNQTGTGVAPQAPQGANVASTKSQGVKPDTRKKGEIEASVMQLIAQHKVPVEWIQTQVGGADINKLNKSELAKLEQLILGQVNANS
jgi:hypothetical protein